MRHFMIFLGAFLSMGNCYALNNFKCVVKGSYTLEKNGELSSETAVAKANKDKEFVVNRATGQITGGGFVNTMSGQMPIVLDYLPKENGYKAITIYKPNPTVDYLQINEYAEGKEKPFFYKRAWGSLVSGTCTYY